MCICGPVWVMLSCPCIFFQGLSGCRGGLCVDMKIVGVEDSGVVWVFMDMVKDGYLSGLDFG